MRPALAQVMHALQAYAGVLADDKGIKATRKLMPADLLATGMLLLPSLHLTFRPHSQSVYPAPFGLRLYNALSRHPEVLFETDSA